MQPLSDNALDDIVARERSLGAPPLTDWDSLAGRLRAEGLIRDPFMARVTSRPWMRIAAAVTLLVGGSALGRLTADVPLGRVTDDSPVATSSASAQSEPASSGELVSNPATPAFASPDEAWDVLNRAGEEYQRASDYLSAVNAEVPMPTPDQYRTRLVALDNVMSEMRTALRDAPQDPVINQYYLATVGAREATLRQLGTTLPASTRLNRF